MIGRCCFLAMLLECGIDLATATTSFAQRAGSRALNAELESPKPAGVAPVMRDSAGRRPRGISDDPIRVAVRTRYDEPPRSIGEISVKIAPELVNRIPEQEVKMDVLVKESGRVSDIRSVRASNKYLEYKAREAALRQAYVPAMSSGFPVPAWLEITVPCRK